MKSKRSTKFALLAALTAALFALGLGACGSDDSGSVSQEELDRAVQEATEQAQREAEAEEDLDKLRRQLRQLKKQGAGANTQGGSTGSGGTSGSGSSGGGTSGGGSNLGVVPDDAKACGAGVFARSGTTSCPFALNVANDYYATGLNTFDSYSPATDAFITMTCTGFDPVICLGGNNAAVYIR